MLTIQKNMQELDNDILVDIDHIEKSSENQFNNLVENAINEKCYEYLLTEKNKKNKVKHIEYSFHKLQKYLQPGKLNVHEGRKIFLLRTRMMETKDNYQSRYSDDLCPLCLKDGIKDSQEHLIQCQSIEHQSLVKVKVKYDDLFSNDVIKQNEISSIIFENFKKRKDMLKQKE